MHHAPTHEHLKYMLQARCLQKQCPCFVLLSGDCNLAPKLVRQLPPKKTYPALRRSSIFFSCSSFRLSRRSRRRCLSCERQRMRRLGWVVDVLSGELWRCPTRRPGKARKAEEEPSGKILPLLEAKQLGDRDHSNQ